MRVADLINNNHRYKIEKSGKYNVYKYNNNININIKYKYKYNIYIISNNYSIK